jgi:uncharacterized membrane protein
LGTRFFHCVDTAGTLFAPFGAEVKNSWNFIITAASVFVAWRLNIYTNVSQPPVPGMSYTGPRQVLLEVVILVF